LQNNQKAWSPAGNLFEKPQPQTAPGLESNKE